MNLLAATLRKKNFRIFFLMLLLSRLGYLYIYGIYADSMSEIWLSGLSVQHPPLYSLFLQAITRIYPSAWLISVMQILIFSFSLSLLASVLFNSVRLFYVFAGLCCLDPNTAHFTSGIMPVSLFISLVCLTLAGFHVYLRNPGPALLAWIIVGSGLVFMIRFQGLILPVVMLIYLLLFPIHRRYYFRTLIIFVLGFQTMLLPFRFLNAQQLDTWRLNGITGISLWNNSSVLYCNSALRVNPRTSFETFVAYKPCGDYTTEHSVQGWHMDHPGSTLNLFLRRNTFTPSESVHFSEELFRTSLSIIIQHPVDYFRYFVWPNLKQIYLQDETREFSPLKTGEKMKEKLQIGSPGYAYFNRYLAWIALGLMIFNLLFQAYYHNSLGFLSLLNVGYLLSIVIMGPVRSSDFLLLTPFISLNVVFLWDKLFYRNTYFRFAYRGL